MLNLFQNIDDFCRKVVNEIALPFLELSGIFQIIIMLGIIFLCVVGAFSIANKLLRKIVAVSCIFILLLIVYLIIFK